MKRMTLVMRDADNNSDEDGSSSGKYVCDNCRADFPNKTTMDRHALFCRTLADIRRGGGGGGSVSTPTHLVSGAADDPLMATPREMFILIQELAVKYNKVKDELDVMKQWAKMVGRRIGGGGGGSAGAAAAAGLDFTSIGRQKRQNMEVILNEEDSEHPDLAELRPAFAEWLTAPDLANTLTDADLNVVFNEDLVAGIAAAILRILAGYTAESGRSHLCPFKLADIKQGAFYIYDTAFGQAAVPPAANGPDLPTTRRWRAMEACEFQLLVRTFHKLLFKEFKKWQDRNWEAQQQMTQKRQKAASSYQQMMSAAAHQCSPAMMSCDGMYPTPSAVEVPGAAGEAVDAAGEAVDAAMDAEDEPVVGGVPLSEDFATLYNKYADKMMGGALSDEAILSKVRAKLWKDMKAWRL